MSGGNRHDRSLAPLPARALRWELTGAGLEKFGRGGEPSLYEVAPPGPGELLARVDACGICFSDIKILTLGGETRG